MTIMSDLLNGIPRVDATAEAPAMRRIVARVLSTDPGLPSTAASWRPSTAR